jgi:hypothetical protein
VLLGRALRRREVVALADGRPSGGFTPQATGAAPEHQGSRPMAFAREISGILIVSADYLSRPEIPSASSFAAVPSRSNTTLPHDSAPRDRRRQNEDREPHLSRD